MNLPDELRALGILVRRNPATGERGFEIILRRIHSIESHLRNLEDRYADLETRLNDHARGTKHRTTRILPTPDQE